MSKRPSFSLSPALPATLTTLLLAGFFATAHAADEADGGVRYSPISIAGQIDVGQVINGETGWHESGSLNGVKFDGDFFQRTGVWITQEATVRDRLSLTMGVGGLFWYALPTGGDPSSKLTQFGPGISQAQAMYKFGDLAAPKASLQMGLFPYKYNPDAKDLGEYLLRSGAYPNYVISGGWNMISSAAYMVEGFRFNLSLMDGRFQSDFILPMEHDIPPMFDLSPTYVATLRAVPGVEFGAGIDCNHCIAIKPSKLSPHIPENQVIVKDSADVDGNHTYLRDSTKFYTFMGLKLMGRLSLDPKAFFTASILGEEDLKLYGEVAVLGLKNYGFLYEKVSERMPLMVGFNVPAFKLLDVLSVEFEYYPTRFPTSLYQPIANQLPTLDLMQGPADKASYDRANKDDVKWAIYAKKEVIKGIQLYAQVASDHLRSIAYNAGPQPTFVPITNRNGKDWYYILRLQFGI
ncbi:MAG: hypothetical protein JWP91_3672 [Fibrobacteres bacterium]|nr:hypothetical protein [Fibrobacterota bacterium]